MTSCEFDERAKQTRSLLQYMYSQQVDRARWRTRSISQVVSSCIEYIVAAFKAAIYEVFLFRIFRRLYSSEFTFLFLCSTRWRTACVQRNLKVISIKSHGKSLLFGYYKLGFRCVELNLFFRLVALICKTLTWKSVSNAWERQFLFTWPNVPNVCCLRFQIRPQRPKHLLLGTSNP